MPKEKLLQEKEAQPSSSEKKKQKRRKKKKVVIDWLDLLRFSFMLFLVGVIVFHYYLVTEHQLGSFYRQFWQSKQEVLKPILLFSGYTLAIFMIGFRFGKRR